jgi:hypothetical protein
MKNDRWRRRPVSIVFGFRQVLSTRNRIKIFKKKLSNFVYNDMLYTHSSDTYNIILHYYIDRMMMMMRRGGGVY